jgi:DtxR family transcriptional regulator, Mn-dependent transcriptional regulator
MISSTVEDYLKAVLKMEDMNEKASTSKVARHLSVADASVTDMLRKLQKAGLLEYKPYYGATLTAQGRQVALKILRRHRLIELFLHQVMGYGWELVHEEAEKLEHVVSDFFVARIDALLKYPDKDPHGEPIPDAQGFRIPEPDMCLTGAEPGDYIICKVTDDRPEFLAYLEKESMVPGTRFTLLEKAPFQGPLKLSIHGRRDPQYIGLEVAKGIYVSPSHPSGVPAGQPTNLAIPQGKLARTGQAGRTRTRRHEAPESAGGRRRKVH